MPSNRWIALPLALSLACTSTEEAEAPHPEDSPEAIAIAAIEAGDWAKARDFCAKVEVNQVLEGARAELEAGRPGAAWEKLEYALEVRPEDRRVRRLRGEVSDAVLPGKLAAARERLLAGDPRGAMLPLDEALRIAPGDGEVSFLRGECLLRMGSEDRNPIMFEDAREAFLAAGEELPEALVGAARAGWMVHFQSGRGGDLDRALIDLREGIASMDPESPFVPCFDTPPARTDVEVRFAAYTASVNGVLAETRRAGLFEETRTAIEAMIGTTPTDTWAWNQLANLYQWESRPEEARDAAQRGLQLNPADVTLHDALVRILNQIGGWDEVVTVYEEFVAGHPDLAIGHWNLGRATYESSMAKLLEEKNDQRDGFRRAEGLFGRARELDAAYRDACLGYEVTSRDGYGWCLYNAGDLDGAADAFRSMEELLPGGMRWEDPGRLWSGMTSLEFLVGEYNKHWMNEVVEVWKDGQGNVAESPIPFEERFPSLLKAAAIADELFAYDPENPTFANNAGYFNRDAGTLGHEIRGLSALTASPPDEAVAKASFAAAVEHAEKSYAAYVVAAELSPDDARVINDTGLILAYYLQRDLDVARDYFEKSIAVGLPQLEAGIEDEEQRTMTREAVGDAYQNLGVIALTIDGDAAAAKPHFEKSFEYERAPRRAVSDMYLPLCEMILAGELDPALVQRAFYWKDLELERVRDRLTARQELFSAD